MRRLSLLLSILGACGDSPSLPDAAKHVDARPRDGSVPIVDAPPDGPPQPPIDAPDAPPGPYQHTIAIDGTDDFLTTERFGTTSATYEADITWDATNLYLGYHGADIDGTTPNAGQKWVFAFVDADPGAATGALVSPTYNTQHAAFPTGFGAEYYLRWKCDGSFATIEQYAAGAWTTSATTPTIARTGQLVELAFPRSLLGGATTAGIATYMINEADQVEATYAGLYPTSFTDGYGAAVPIAHYLRADFTAMRAPNDPANQAP